MAGLTDTGFESLTEPEIRDGIETELKDEYGTSLPLGDGTLFGKLVGIVSERYATLWELGQLLADSLDPDAAVGALLAALSALTGTRQQPALPSTVVMTLTGNDTTVVSGGSRASVLVTEDEFASDDDATITALTAWASATAYVVGDRVSNMSYAWVCTVAGTSAGSGGPDPTGLNPFDTTVDNTVTWRLMGEGAGAVDVAGTATVTGPIIAVAGDLQTIETPVSGWLGVINLSDADEGSDQEADEDLRLRREDELAGAGTGPVDSLRAALLNPQNYSVASNAPTVATIFENLTDVTDADGVPPHAVEILVLGGDDDEIAQVVFDNIDAGTRMHGTTTVNVTDSEGNTRPISFSRPTVTNIYVDVTLTYEAGAYGGDTAVQTAVAGVTNRPGLDAVSSRIKGAIFAADLGVLDVSLAYIGTAPSPSAETTIAIGTRAIADYDTSRVTVTSSAATP